MTSALFLIHDTDVPIIVLRRNLKGKSPKVGFVEFRPAATSAYPDPGISLALKRQAPIHVSSI